MNCEEITDDGWVGDGERMAFWCRRCWASWDVPGTPKRPGRNDDAFAPVFVVGLPKCGTTSLQFALESAGYGAVHCYAPKPWGPEGADRFLGHLMMKAWGQGREPLHLLPNWVNAITQMDCWWIEEEPVETEVATGNSDPDRPLETHKIQPTAQDGTSRKFKKKSYGLFPQITLLEELDTRYPDAKFILNVRETKEWLRSSKAYGCFWGVLVDADIPGLPHGVGADDQDLANWYESHIERVRCHFADRESSKFLEIALEEGDAAIRAHLEAFLGTEVVWGHHNATTWS